MTLVAPNEAHATTPLRLTGRQKMALMLRKGGYKPAQIADRLDIRADSVSKLLARAEKAEAQIQRAIEHELERSDLA